MMGSEERRRPEIPPRERVEDGVEEDEDQRPVPIDENVVGELNAALPEEQPLEGNEDAEVRTHRG
jgi:hypothetical protein